MVRVARRNELPAGAEERDQEREVHGRLLEVEALREVGDGGGRDDHDGEVPRAALAAGEAAREPDHPEPEGKRECPGGRRDARRQHAVHEAHAVGRLGRQRRDDRDEAGSDCEPGKEDGRRGAAHPRRVAALPVGGLPLRRIVRAGHGRCQTRARKCNAHVSKVASDRTAGAGKSACLGGFSLEAAAGHVRCQTHAVRSAREGRARACPRSDRIWLPRVAPASRQIVR